MLKKIFVFIAAVLTVIAIVASQQPDEFRVTRSARIAAAPAVVFAQVNQLDKWDAWSPWAKIDPAMKKSLEGPPAGVGAISTWSGNSEVGEGRMTITDSQPNELVRFRLDFIRPFTATNSAEFTFKPEGAETVVIWTMSGHKNLIAKAVGLFMDCDKMVGGQFEKGLAQLKAVAENSPPA